MSVEDSLEQAEDMAKEGQGDPFMTKVAMTMAIIAAAVATVGLMGDNKGDDVLESQGMANRLLTEAASLRVESSNTFSRYQSKKGRMEEKEHALAFTKLFAPAQGSEQVRAEYVKKWEAYIESNRTSPKDIRIGEDGFPAKTADGKEDDTLGALLVTGIRYKEMADQKVEEAAKFSHEAETAHNQGDKLDLGHLFLEFGLVLCTISVLTRRNLFWIAGVTVAVTGVGFAVQAFLIG